MNITLSEDQKHATVDGRRLKFVRSIIGCGKCFLEPMRMHSPDPHLPHTDRCSRDCNPWPQISESTYWTPISGILPCTRWYRNDREDGHWEPESRIELHEDEGG